MLTLLLAAAMSCAAPPEVCFSPGRCDLAVVDVIEHAQRTVDVFAYAINRETIVRALVAARRRGLAVRVLADRLQARNRKERPVLAQLVAAGIPVRLHARTKIMHIKAVVADGTTVVYGSMNHTDPGAESNDEVTTSWDCTGLAQRFAAEFGPRWDRAVRIE